MPASGFNHTVLAGGGHTHALILQRWASKPERRPSGLITLINRGSETFYSGMIPSLIAGTQQPDEIKIDLRSLAQHAGISFINSEIEDIDAIKKNIRFQNRDPIKFDYLSLNVGATGDPSQRLGPEQVTIKPLHEALALIKRNDCYGLDARHQEFSIIGSGLASIEISFALRNRWPKRKITLHVKADKLTSHIKKALQQSNIKIVLSNNSQRILGPALFCTGSFAPGWLENSGLSVNHRGRILTRATLQVIEHPYIFASGDCGVIYNKQRPASGVWAVRAAPILAMNLERINSERPLRCWTPQKRSLQMIGQPENADGAAKAWIHWGSHFIGPYQWAWQWKQLIDKRFIAMFRMQSAMDLESKTMDCRGCAAKLAAQPLKNALESAELGSLGRAPEDAAVLDKNWLQSVDGFPAILSDPWLNARITTLHACSDLWACGATVASAQVFITVPNIQANLQENLLEQILSGIKGALEEQRATLLGGHTLESRDQTPTPASMGIQIGLCVNGQQQSDCNPWTKGGLRSGDMLLMSKPIGTGVLFAAAMHHKTNSIYLDKAIELMATSQHHLIGQLRELEMKHPESIHACTDVTGFGLMGHLGEMLQASHHGCSAHIKLDSVPVLDGAISLLKRGYASSLAPSNRQAWRFLDPNGNQPPLITIEASQGLTPENKDCQAMLELLVDPQTCGPLLLGCSPDIGKQILQQHCNWKQIGTIHS